MYIYLQIEDTEVPNMSFPVGCKKNVTLANIFSFPLSAFFSVVQIKKKKQHCFLNLEHTC